MKEYNWRVILAVTSTGPNREIAFLNMLNAIGIEDPDSKPNVIFDDAELTNEETEQ